jgi:predicted ester cyclase
MALPLVPTFRSLANVSVFALGVVASSNACSQSPAVQLSPDQARRAVAPFYDMLNRPAGKDLKALAETAMAPDWRSYSGEKAFKGRDEFVAQVAGFGQLIPDLAWDIREVLVDGNRVIVRSEASGTPQGPLFGVPPSGKRFQIMTIDIHTVVNGKLATAHHVEDWAGALRQLSAK